jgi:choline dehydrogenase-like flavoprotein
VFPSASGVNPMVTNMGISRGIARHIVEQTKTQTPKSKL